MTFSSIQVFSYIPSKIREDTKVCNKASCNPVLSIEGREVYYSVLYVILVSLELNPTISSILGWNFRKIQSQFCGDWHAYLLHTF